MKKLLATVMALVMALSLLPTAVWATTTTVEETDAVASVTKGGESTTTYYPDLHEALAAAEADGTVTLLKDVTLTGDWAPVDVLVGTFDGNNHTISGLNIGTYVTNQSVTYTHDGAQTNTVSGAGMFLCLNGTIKNLTIDGANINVPDAANNVGVLAGSAFNATLNKVTIKNADIESAAQYVGGLYGTGWGAITDCEVSDSTIVGKDQVGGLVGFYWLASIDNCRSLNNTIEATEERAGGILGKFQADDDNGQEFTIKNCKVSGGSATAPDYTGGLAGQFMGDIASYSITNNTVENFTLNSEKERSALATIRDGNDNTFTNALDSQITGNTLENIESTLDESWKIKKSYSNFAVYERCEAQIGDEKYTTLGAAIDAVTGSQETAATVKLLKDVTLSNTTVVENKNIILDLNGHTLDGGTQTEASTLTSKGSSVVTIKDSSTNGGGKVVGSLSKEGSAELKVEGGTFTVDPTGYLAEGYKITSADNTYTVERIYSTVTFNSVNGSAVEAQSIEYGQTATAPTNPTRDGYTFDGWYTDTGYTTKWNFSNDAVTKDITLYAKWNKITTDGTTAETKLEKIEDENTTGTKETVVETAKNNTKTTTITEETIKTTETGTVETKSTAVTTKTAAAETTTTTETVTNKDTSGNVTGSTETTTKATTTAGTTTTTKVETTKDASGAVSQAVKTTKDSTNSLIAETTTTPASTEAKAEVKTETVNTAIQNTSSDKSVTLDATAAETDSAVTKTVITVPKETMPLLNTAAKDSVIKALTVETDVATLAIDNTALKTLTTQTTANGKLELVVEKTNVDTATSQTSGQTTTTTTATYELTAMVNGEKVFQETNQDKNGTITVTVPWTSAPGFRQQIVCYYVADDGTRTRMGGAGYKNNTFSWDTNHFSKFEVVSETVSTSRAYINLNGSSSGTTTTTTTVKKTASANTFDAGVGVYAATAILSVTGMAWVGKKKH